MLPALSNFWIGVNYWASHAGTDMWRRWDEDSVAQDLAALRDTGATVLRVFPNWRDFQPVTACYGANHQLREYRMPDDAPPARPDYLDPVMLQRFARLCELAAQNGLRLIVGLLTGWMSGRLFVPPALAGKNLYTDPEALWLQQLFVQGFVTELVGQPAILAWDLGNECNCMDRAETRAAACHWTATVVQAIRAADASRLVISGMHSLTPEGVWTLADQGYWTDLLTTHPYPHWVEHADRAPVDHLRTLLHATAQTAYYAGLGHRPCLVEEIGTMGPMLADEEVAANFLRVNLWSNWAHGSPGVLWWCAFDQDHLIAPPYDWNMCERELGLLRSDRTPKPVARELQSFARAQRALGLRLPPPCTDAVCLISREQEAAGVAYMSFVLAKQAGLTLRFAYVEDETWPDSPLYLLPSVTGEVMSRRRYLRLWQKVEQGAVLYLSMDGGFLTRFEALTGFRVRRAASRPVQGNFVLDGEALPYAAGTDLELEPAEAEVLLADTESRPLLGRHPCGQGTVFTLNFPLEKMLLPQSQGTDRPYYRLYERFSRAAAAAPPWLTRSDPNVGLTLHRGTWQTWAVLINYTGTPRNPGLCLASGVTAVSLYGDAHCLAPFGTAVLRLQREEK